MYNNIQKEYLNHLFNMDQVAYLTYIELSDDDKIRYLRLFKKEISIEDFDNFCIYYDDGLNNDFKRKILKEVYDINVDKIIFYSIPEHTKKERVDNKAFNRSLKLKLLFQ